MGGREGRHMTKKDGVVSGRVVLKGRMGKGREGRGRL